MAVEARQPVVTETLQFEPNRLGDEFRSFLRLLQPRDVPGAKKIRVGGESDGGYIMLDDFAPARHALSLGVGAETSWDIAMAARALDVFQYDHSVEASPQMHKHLVFHRKRVVAEARASEEITLAQIMAEPAIAGDDNVIAKIDIEGDEWGVLAKAQDKVLARIRQLVIEFHSMRSFPEAGWRRTAFAALRNLSLAHCCIHVHGNNWTSFAVVGGVPFPDAFEATFVRRADHETVPSACVFPTELDRPCNPKKPDLYLGRWTY